LIVHGNDMEAAMAAIEAQKEKPVSVSEFYKSKQHRDLVASSKCVRSQAAHQLAKALGVTIEDEPDITAATHILFPAERAAHQTTVAPAAMREGTEQYMVLNGCYDVSSAHQGVLVHQGPMGGYALVQKTKTSTLASGVPSRRWTTEACSILSMAAPYHDDATSTGDAALHRQSNKDTRAAFPNSVFWRSSLSGLHPRADERRSLVTQSLVHTTAKPKEEGAELRVVQHKMIAVQLPAHEAQDVQTLDELVRHAKATGAASLPVPLDSDAMRTLTRHFDAINTEATLQDVIANSVTEPANDLFTLRSGCKNTDPMHVHHFYTEDDEAEAAAAAAGGGGGGDVAPVCGLQQRRRRTHPRMTKAATTPVPRCTRVWLDTEFAEQLAAAEKKSAQQGSGGGGTSCPAPSEMTPS
jgi:hypothetical protein